MQTILKVKAFPDAKKDAVLPQGDGVFEVYTRAPAHQGQANRAIAILLAQHLHIPTKSLRLIRGFQTRSKLFQQIIQQINA